MKTTLSLLHRPLCLAPGRFPARRRKPTPAPAPQGLRRLRPPLPRLMDREVTIIENDIVPAAEAMPEDKYNFAPTAGDFKDVRTFALQVKHVANTNCVFFFRRAWEKKPRRWIPATITAPGIDEDQGRDREISERLFLLFGHRAAKSLTTENSIEQRDPRAGRARPRALPGKLWRGARLSTTTDRLVVYLRMNKHRASREPAHGN